MAYLGNLTCRGCGLTFTSRWGNLAGADEYRCLRDHITYVEPSTGSVLRVQGVPVEGRTLAGLRGSCVVCATELATGLLPACPVCGDRDHDVAVGGFLDWGAGPVC